MLLPAINPNCMLSNFHNSSHLPFNRSSQNNHCMLLQNFFMEPGVRRVKQFCAYSLALSRLATQKHYTKLWWPVNANIAELKIIYYLATGIANCIQGNIKVLIITGYVPVVYLPQLYIFKVKLITCCISVPYSNSRIIWTCCNQVPWIVGERSWNETAAADCLLVTSELMNLPNHSNIPQLKATMENKELVFHQSFSALWKFAESKNLV